MPINSKNYFAKMNIAIFEGRDPGGVLWQPRLENWSETNQRRGTLPSHMVEFSLLDLYDYCHASIRYFVKPLKQQYKTVEVVERWLDNNSKEKIFRTPFGELREVYHYDEIRLTSYPSEFRIKSVKDFKIHEYLLSDEQWYWDQEVYDIAIENTCFPQTQISNGSGK